MDVVDKYFRDVANQEASERRKTRRERASQYLNEKIKEGLKERRLDFIP